MAYISFRRIDLLPGQTVSAWFITNASIVNQDTRYTFYDSTGNIVSEYIGTKPVITSTELTKAEVEAVLTGTITSHTHSNASQSIAGLMSKTDKTKLDGIASGANKYVHPTLTRTNSTGTATPAFGGTFSVIESITSNTEGHVTGVKTTTVTVPTPSYPTVNNGTLTLKVSGLGLSGSSSFSANQAGNATFTVTSNATANNTASTIVARDANKNFSANTVTTKSVKIGDGEVEILYDNISESVRFVWN